MGGSRGGIPNNWHKIQKSLYIDDFTTLSSDQKDLLMLISFALGEYTATHPKFKVTAMNYMEVINDVCTNQEYSAEYAVILKEMRNWYIGFKKEKENIQSLRLKLAAAKYAAARIVTQQKPQTVPSSHSRFLDLLGLD